MISVNDGQRAAAQQSALAASDVGDRCARDVVKRRQHRLGAHAERAAGTLRLSPVVGGVVVQARRRATSAKRAVASATIALVREVAARDQLAVGVLGQPALAGAQQLADLVVATPSSAWRRRAREAARRAGGAPLRAGRLRAAEVDVARVAPLRELGSSGIGVSSTVQPSGSNRRDRSPVSSLAPARCHSDLERERMPRRAREASRCVPVIAVRNTWPIATASIDDDAYGRSLT